MPGLRALQKYAVRVRRRHQSSLRPRRRGADQGQPRRRRRRRSPRRSSAARAGVGHLVKIEVEVDHAATSSTRRCAVGVDAVLLDNMGPEQLRRGGAPHRRPRHHRSVGPHHARDGARDCRDRRRPDLGRLADAQRAGARHRARSGMAEAKIDLKLDRRLGRPARPGQDLPGRLRRRGDPRLGHDRRRAARHPAQGGHPAFGAFHHLVDRRIVTPPSTPLALTCVTVRSAPRTFGFVRPSSTLTWPV